MEIEVKFSLKLPVEATDEQIQEWLDFNLIGGAMSLGNPLSDYEPEARTFSIQFDKV